MITSKSMQAIAHKQVVTIKLGGSMLEQLAEPFFSQVKALQDEGVHVVIVHGGGPAINAALTKQGIQSEMKNGIRVTSTEAIDVVQETLIGRVNPSLVQQLNQNGLSAVGLSGFDGSLLQCRYLDQNLYGSVGSIEHVNTELLDAIITSGTIPVISSIGVSAEGKALNINADTVAGQVAQAISASSLLFVTDTPGIKLQGESQSVISKGTIEEAIHSGEIYGGMIPKVEAALSCMKIGVPSVQIVGPALQGTTIQQEVLQ